jgi:hypothetical protein
MDEPKKLRRIGRELPRNRGVTGILLGSFPSVGIQASTTTALEHLAPDTGYRIVEPRDPFGRAEVVPVPKRRSRPDSLVGDDHAW